MHTIRAFRTLSLTALLAGCLAAPLSAMAQEAAPTPAPDMKQMMGSYSPELKQKVMALSPDLKATMGKLHAQHTRKSNQLTLRQVMHEILAEYQSIAAGIATDNAEQAADSARRLANHRIPKGGLLPYFPLDKVNNTDMGVLPAMNEAVEGSAKRLADAADKGDMAKAATHLSDIMSGCVACHQKFRGQPGISAQLMTPAAQ